MFAITTSASSSGWSSGRYTSKRSSTPLRRAFSFVACSACGSISMPMTRLAPNFSAANAKIPEPQPKSTTVLSVISMPSSQRKQSAVVGCVPVPKARPGSNITLTAFGSGTSRQLGHIHKRSPNCMGWKLSIHSRSQSLSSSGSSLYLKSGPKTLALPKR